MNGTFLSPLLADGLAWFEAPDPVILFALTLVFAGLAGEFVFRWLRLPRITGYALIGILMGTSGLAEANPLDSAAQNIVTDIALGILLFELGSRVRLAWLRANPWLFATSLAEAGLTAVAVQAGLVWFGVPAPAAVAAGLIAMSTSPAVVMQVTAEIRSQGQVTERLYVLTALNAIYAVLAMKFLAGWWGFDTFHDGGRALLTTLYLISGSLLMAALLAWAVHRLTRALDLREEPGAAVLFGLLLLTFAALHLLGLPAVLAPLLAGILLKNVDPRPWLWPRHFGTAGGVLVLLLFVLGGANLRWEDFFAGGLAGLALVGVRVLAKVVGVSLFARPSGLGLRQCLALGVALSPFSAVALALVLDFRVSHPDLGAALAPVLLSAMAVMELLGPIATQWSLRLAGEVRR
ncbi:Na+/H+ antiporter [Oryzomicrobium terrae]|uniref:Na+/H+ antiporter n=1 Tax=Oryzomicrobium terrae TaxID=1735038 RepID=A0A5C1E5S7_9RHOO|nr:cation:proton antiporter [Oryzomicrobium terrae]QEL64250.1 Na+/H+ antiporter [Oryzomicrobium terrae]